MESNPEISPIVSRLDLPRWLVAKGLTGYGAEIGVLFGEYSAHLLSYWPGTLFMVDSWVNQDPEIYLDGTNSVVMSKAHAKAVAAVEIFGDRAYIMRDFSLSAAKQFALGTLDFCFLDANHSKPSIEADLRAWWDKVKPGGLLCGHDFYERHDDWHECGVESAVTEFCAERKLKFHTTECTSWWIEKPV